jgi:hypothetical protein
MGSEKQEPDQDHEQEMNWRETAAGTPPGALIDTIIKAINFSIHKRKWSHLPLAK